MLSIEEAIERERQQAKEQRSYIGTWDDEYSKKCEVYAEEHEQLADWLEELKMLRELKVEHRKIGNIEGFNKGYNEAIDDFVEACDNQFIAMYGQKYIDMRNIKEIAEQLKAGVQE